MGIAASSDRGQSLALCEVAAVMPCRIAWQQGVTWCNSLQRPAVCCQCHLEFRSHVSSEGLCKSVFLMPLDSSHSAASWLYSNHSKMFRSCKYHQVSRSSTWVSMFRRRAWGHWRVLVIVGWAAPCESRRGRSRKTKEIMRCVWLLRPSGKKLHHIEAEITLRVRCWLQQLAKCTFKSTVI